MVRLIDLAQTANYVIVVMVMITWLVRFAILSLVMHYRYYYTPINGKVDSFIRVSN